MGLLARGLGAKSALMGIALTLCLQIESIYPATHGIA